MINFIRRIAIDTAVRPEVVKKVIDWQFEEVRKQARNTNVKSMEITGLGTMTLKGKRLRVYIKAYERKIELLKKKIPTLDTERKRKFADKKLKWLEEDLIEIRKRYEME